MPECSTFPHLQAPSTLPPVGRPMWQHHCHEEAHRPSWLRQSQDWIDARLANLVAEDFCPGGLHIYTAQKLVAPPGFQNIWGNMEIRHRVGQTPSHEELHVLRSVATVLLFVDIADQVQMRKAIDMADFIKNNSGGHTPGLILVMHSVGMELREPIDENAVEASIARAFDYVDEIITTEFEGTRFAWEVLLKVKAQPAWVQKSQILQRGLAERTQDEEDALGWDLHDTVWEHCRRRLGARIPEMNCSMASGAPKNMANYRIGAMLGHGTRGRVYKLLRLDGKPAGSVLKVAAKTLSVRTLQHVHQQVNAMQILSGEYSHPNITKFYDMFHSQTHVFYEMEDGGPANLVTYLRDRERQGIAVPIKTAQEILSQLMLAVRHLHQTAIVVHRDIKSENIFVLESQTDITIKLADFASAKADPKVPSSGFVGTFPFTAPEISLESAYDPFAIDIWSMGIVSLEVLCFVQVLEHSLQLNAVMNESMRSQHRRIHRFFSEHLAVNRILANIRRELQPMINSSLLLTLQNVLNVDAGQRWPADQAYAALDRANQELA